MKKRVKIEATHIAKKYIQNKINEDEELRDFLFDKIREEKHKTKTWMDKVTKKMSSNEQEEFYDWHAGDYQKYEDTFLKRVNDFLAVFLYSLIESGLDSIAINRGYDKSKSEEESGRIFKSRLENAPDKGIQRARKYLKREIGIDILKICPDDWNEIIALKKIRNVIVHEEGWMDKKTLDIPTIKKHIESGEIEIKYHHNEDYGRIILKQSYINKITSQIKGFFEKI